MKRKKKKKEPKSENGKPAAELCTGERGVNDLTKAQTELSDLKHYKLIHINV